MEGYSLHCCLPVLLWLPSRRSWRGRPLVILRIPVFKITSHSAFSSSDAQQQTKQQTKPEELQWSKDKSPRVFCRNVLGFSVLLISCSTFCFLLYSLFTSTSFAPFLNKISDIFPSFLDSCIEITFLPYLVLHSISPVIRLSCFSLLLAAICLIHCFFSFPVYFLDWKFEM